MKIEALRKFLNTDAPIVQSTYNDNLFIINPHTTRRGASPSELIEDTAMLRAKLITMFGPEAETWDSNFLRLQEIESEDLRPAVISAKKKLESATKALPMIQCECRIGKHEKFSLRREPLEGDHSFIVETEAKDYIDRTKIRKVKTRWVPYGNISATNGLVAKMINVKILTDEYDRLYQKYHALRGYHQLDSKIKASFDWNRLGNNHDNETAHAYQAIVNPLYIVGSKSKFNDGEYQQKLRDAFDGKELVDTRPTEETNDGEYLVLINDEADDAVATSIKELIWAFRASFLESYMPLKAKEIAKMQESMCEDCNEAFLAMINNGIGDLIEAAIKADGRGHFLSSYDGKENTVNEMFIYVQDKPWDGGE